MPLELIDSYGLPIAGVVFLAIALHRTVNFVQSQLLQQIELRHKAEMSAIEDLQQEHQIFHDIITKLISNAKNNQLELQKVVSNIDMLVKLLNK